MQGSGVRVSRQAQKIAPVPINRYVLRRLLFDTSASPTERFYESATTVNDPGERVVYSPCD